MNNLNIKALEALKSGQFKVLEYGNPVNPCGWETGLRIRFMNTAGGMQFRMCSVNQRMQEHGSFYTADIEEMRTESCKAVVRYEKPSENAKLRELMKDFHKNTPALSWYGLSADPNDFHKGPSFEDQLREDVASGRLRSFQKDFIEKLLESETVTLSIP